MKRISRTALVVVAASSAFALAGCGGGSAAPSGSPSASTPSSPSSSPSSSPTSSSTSKSITQWATSATATSNYGEAPGSPWNASNATGGSIVNLCGDDGRAWASLKKSTVDTLTLKYATPVIPSQIDVFESYNPGYVTSVVVSGAGQSATVYTAQVEKTTQCPKTLTIPVTKVPFPINTIAVTVDQTTLDDWAEIDAVRLTGTP